MLVSTFELLVKPIAPAGSGPSIVARTVVQGYFLTVANTSPANATLMLTFTATTPNLNLAQTVTISDVTGTNTFGDLIASPTDPKKFTYNFTVPANDTVLVTLLPDLSTDSLPPIGEPDLITRKALEIRGYVEISLSSIFSKLPQSFNLLLTPEHRGTFLPQNLAAPSPDFDQLVYSLPTATGKAQFTLRSINFLLPSDTVDADTLTGLQETLGMMAQRIDDLDQRLTTGQSSVPSQGGLPVGQPVINNQPVAPA